MLGRQRRDHGLHGGAREAFTRVRHDVPAHEEFAAELADQGAMVDGDKVRHRLGRVGKG